MWLAAAAFELVIFMMTVIKGVRHFRQPRSSLISLIYRDGMLYFVSIFGLRSPHILHAH
ncbi:hypothetical protein AURDEDRAFT_178141 [Auricularia subglabra TFB-10046 SS5]|uniref:Uncharacterized protein n=1 Tax=Auricularia subglabra (strain TFB-10046 / SS5) TaxID=717982 RepID=J0D2B9_AURST|nr:hypothetical protein AURDEDRAFT_178141 [Auricularia subglabra TFB-10046 SS5]